MKAKDIALLCTAAGAAGIAAGAAAAAGEKSRTAKKPRKEAVHSPQRSAEKVISISSAPLMPEGNGLAFVAAAPCREGICAVYEAGGDSRAFVFSGSDYREVRCPVGAYGIARAGGSTAFINARGAVFVPDDPEGEPVLCGINSPAYICAHGSDYYIFSDSLLYICTPDGGIAKIVSLYAMMDIPDGDVCDAENSDDSFSSFSVKIKKVCFFEGSPFAAVITEDGRSFLMCSEEDSCSFEEAYPDVSDAAFFGSDAYYICRLSEGYGLIRTRVGDGCCETVGKFRLCGSDRTPVGIAPAVYGLAVNYSDGGVGFLFARAEDEGCREFYRNALANIGTELGGITADEIFPSENGLFVRCGKELTAYTFSRLGEHR